MIYKIVLFALLTGVFVPSAYCGGDILPPTIPKDYDGKSPIGKWKLRNPKVFEEKQIAKGEKLWPYHAWINSKKKDATLEVVFITKSPDSTESDNDKNRKKVSFVITEDENGPIDPTHYEFVKTSENGFVEKKYKSEAVEGGKYDHWSNDPEQKVKPWNPWPEGIPENFTTIFKYIGPQE